MSRTQEIASLKARLAKAISARHFYTAWVIRARLTTLMTQQLRAELRQDRRAS